MSFFRAVLDSFWHIDVFLQGPEHDEITSEMLSPPLSARVFVVSAKDTSFAEVELGKDAQHHAGIARGTTSFDEEEKDATSGQDCSKGE